MSKLRILYAASEINPFLQTSQVAQFLRKLPQAVQERGAEIRILVPRFGLINERKNRLHEVVRLSGINITVGDEEKPLIIKVASVPQAKMQVYFIDNEDYFQRKYAFYDKNNKFYADNDERMVFFCKGVIETVKKLGWAPDIIHCNDWVTSLIPMYVKTTYRKEPIFQNTKTIFSVYNNYFSHKFDKGISDKVKMTDIDEKALSSLATHDYEGLIRIAAQYADAVVRSNESYSEELDTLFKEIEEQKKIEMIGQEEWNTEAADEYYDLYNDLSGVSV